MAEVKCLCNPAPSKSLKLGLDEPLSNRSGIELIMKQRVNCLEDDLAGLGQRYCLAALLQENKARFDT